MRLSITAALLTLAGPAWAWCGSTDEPCWKVEDEAYKRQTEQSFMDKALRDQQEMNDQKLQDMQRQIDELREERRR